jgi:hypothetical protein
LSYSEKCRGRIDVTVRDTVWLFSYGTLRQPAVQQALFGRRLAEEVDRLEGFRIDTIEIEEPDIVNLSGKAIHLILRRSTNGGAPIDGAALAVSEAEMAMADAYEGENYVRILVTLASGRAAFVYVAPGDR